jgi:hypothetical protein
MGVSFLGALGGRGPKKLGTLKKLRTLKKLGTLMKLRTWPPRP